ncbi:MAG TPA: Crp/Fnr family transcriptional regulator [Chitinophagaceae bacterium]|nr:Crp/Fnr family transcriptional regulator [Chitinophagaceae bacterium]
MNKLLEFLKKQFPISEKDWQTFSNCLEAKTFCKKKIILQAGKIENYLYFIDTGILRVYSIKKDKEITIGFGFQDSFFSSYTSFLTRQPSHYNVQAITDVSLWCITYENLQKIYTETQYGQFFGRLAAEQLFIKKSQRELSLLRLSAEERYVQLLKHHTELVQHIPLQYLASYIVSNFA